MNSALMLHRHASPAVAGSYLAGAVAGAITTAAGLLVVAGLLSPIPFAWRSMAALVCLMLLALRVFGIACIDLPQRTYQIPRETFRAAPTSAAFRFAFELGTGVRTYITATAPYALAVILALQLPSELVPAVLAAASAGVGYGVGRSVVVASQSVRAQIAVDHPSLWLRAADRIAVATALGVVVFL